MNSERSRFGSIGPNSFAKIGLAKLPFVDVPNIHVETRVVWALQGREVRRDAGVEVNDPGRQLVAQQLEHGHQLAGARVVVQGRIELRPESIALRTDPRAPVGARPAVPSGGNARRDEAVEPTGRRDIQSRKAAA